MACIGSIHEELAARCAGCCHDRHPGGGVLGLGRHAPAPVEPQALASAVCDFRRLAGCLQAGQGLADQPQSAKGVTFKQLLENLGNRGSGFDQISDDSQSPSRCVRVAEPACVHGNGRQDTRRYVGIDFALEVINGLENESSRGFDRGVYQEILSQVRIATDMVVDHQLGPFELAYPFTKPAQLAPARKVENDQGLSIF